MSFHDEDEIADEVIGLQGDGAPVGTIIEVTLSHRRQVLGALGSGGFAVAGRVAREDLLQQPEGATRGSEFRGRSRGDLARAGI